MDMAYRAAICDDSAQDAAFVREMLESWAREKQIGLQAEVFPSAESFLFRYEEDKAFDLLLLDIEMGRMDGVTMARRVREENKTVQIVFITGYSDYIAEGYEVAALHYLMKPVSRKKLFAVLERALEQQKRNERCLNLELPGELVRLPLHEIRYLEVHRNEVTLHAGRAYTVRRTLSDFERELDGRFCRVGRALILNLDCVRRVTRTAVTLADGTQLPLPRGAYELLNRAIIAHT